MYQSDHTTQKDSGAQNDNQTGYCTTCGAPVAGIDAVGPDEVRLDPCGHQISDSRIPDLYQNQGQGRKRPVNVDSSDVATDGGEDTPERIDWPFEAVVHGADVDEDCLALTGSGKPCSYSAYATNDLPVCNTHASVDDPTLVEGAHQWARIHDGTRGETITVCIACQAVWRGLEPETAVDCPTCSAGAGERCIDASSTYSASIPPHADRRERAYEVLEEFDPCPDGPTTDEQAQLVTDGGQASDEGTLRKKREENIRQLLPEDWELQDSDTTHDSLLVNGDRAIGVDYGGTVRLLEREDDDGWEPIRNHYTELPGPLAVGIAVWDEVGDEQGEPNGGEGA